jgi:hypothetical protein
LGHKGTEKAYGLMNLEGRKAGRETSNWGILRELHWVQA